MVVGCYLAMCIGYLGLLHLIFDKVRLIVLYPNIASARCMLHSCICGAFSAIDGSFVCVYLPVFDKVQAQGRHLAVTAWHCLHSLTTADARFLLLAMRHTFSSLIQEYIIYIRGYFEAIKIKSFGRCYKHGFSRNVTRIP